MKLKRHSNFNLNEAKGQMKGGMLYVNLLDDYRERGYEKEYRDKFDEWKNKMKDFRETNEEHDLQVGDIIEFTAGYNDDIRYTTEILGFDGENNAYVLWDCFWFPVPLGDSKRNVKLIKKAE